MPIEKLAVQFNDKYMIAIPRIMIAMANGVTKIDTSLAGTGKVMKYGAPYNVPTEDVLHMCALLDIETGVDPKKLIEAGHNLSK